MARVIVTVRPGFEDAVNFYFKTGLIWKGGEVPVPGDDLYISLSQEMQKPLGEKKGKPWRNRLPTALTILQADSIGLKVEKALPCACDDDSDFEDNLGSFCNTDPEFGFTKPNALIGGEIINIDTKPKASINGNVQGLEGDDYLKVVLRKFNNEIVSMDYRYGDGDIVLENLPAGSYELNWDDENVLTDNYAVVNGQIKTIIHLQEGQNITLSLGVQQNR